MYAERDTVEQNSGDIRSFIVFALHLSAFQYTNVMIGLTTSFSMVRKIKGALRVLGQALLLNQKKL